MACHLVKSGYHVTGFDVWAPSVEKFAGAGGGSVAAGSAREAARQSEVFICMVANAKQAEAVLFDEERGAVKGMSVAVPDNSESCRD